MTEGVRKVWNDIAADEKWLCVGGLVLIMIVAGALAYMLISYRPLTEGEVIGKKHLPAFGEYVPESLAVNGKQKNLPRHRYYGERWRITVRNGDDEDIWYVSEKYYDSVRIGDWVTK